MKNDRGNAAARSARILIRILAALTLSLPVAALAATTLRINSGGPAFVDNAGNAWQADSSYVTGSSSTLNWGPFSIAGASDSTLFETERFAANLHYAVGVASGNYHVVLRFAEHWAGSVGQRVFNVQIEGVTVATNVDLFKTVGLHTAYSLAFDTPVADGQLNIDLVGVVDNAFVNGIEITGLDSVATSPGGGDFTGDFDGDGKRDILWRNSSGAVALWLMNGGVVKSGISVATVGLDWTIAGVGDFDGDGKSDILWRNSSGAVALWLMNGGAVKAGPGVATVGSDWTIAGVGDFDGDRKSDILWRNSTGAVALWLMNGGAVKASPGVATVGSDWAIAGVGDFDADGKSDILWRSSAGAVALWMMNGGAVKASPGIATVGADWIISGVGDFDGDGKSDILWRNSTGAVAFWLMNGGALKASAGVATVGSDWTIAGVGDFDGDGKRDILWRNATGAVALWEMNGGAIKAGVGVTTAGQDWQIAGGGSASGGSSSGVPAPPTVQPTSIVVRVLGVAPSVGIAQVSANDRDSLPLTYSIATQPTVGTASINANSGLITYAVTGYPRVTSDSFTVRVANAGASATGTVSVALNGDPLLANQWHIQNTGQFAYSSTFPISGNDMNVSGAWAAGYSGKGIKVGVVDSGLEVAHEDLAANVDMSHSYNFSIVGGLFDRNNPSPTGTGEDHGTQVAGIIGAVAFNGKGGRGVAYNATLRGYNLLQSFNNSAFVSNMAIALGGDPTSADNDVFNASWSYQSGGSDALPTLSQAVLAATTKTTTLRGGKGAAYVTSAGNDFLDIEYANPNRSNNWCRQFAQEFKVSCGDPATDDRRGGYEPIIVGAINANGAHSSYSSTGSSLWLSAPGGEVGWDNSYVPGQGDDYDYQPAIVTTARTGCANATFKSTPNWSAFPNGFNALDSNGANPLAAACQYTALMNGTSAAAPNVSGTVALMLEANPNLSVRDIKLILAKTANQKRPDQNFKGVTWPRFLPFTGPTTMTLPAASKLTLEQGWIDEQGRENRNGAGYWFSNRYGFGALDTSAAVAMAQSYTEYLPPIRQSLGNYAVVASPPIHLTDGGYRTWTHFSFVTDDPQVAAQGPGTSSGSMTTAFDFVHGEYLSTTNTVAHGDAVWNGGVSPTLIDPAVYGAISTISMSADVAMFGSGETGWALVIEQAGRRYYSVPIRVFSGGWATVTASGLTAADFDTNPWAGLYGVAADGNRPDFSRTAPPLKFGYVVGNTFGGAGTATVSHGLGSGVITFDTSGPGAPISQNVPPQSTDGVVIDYAVAESFKTVEFVVVAVNIDSTPMLPCNQIELTSPSGTKSILLHAANGLINTKVTNTHFESNAFYGESVNGTWKLRFLDYCPATGTATALSTTLPQTLTIYGH